MYNTLCTLCCTFYLAKKHCEQTNKNYNENNIQIQNQTMYMCLISFCIKSRTFYTFKKFNKSRKRQFINENKSKFTVLLWSSFVGHCSKATVDTPVRGLRLPITPSRPLDLAIRHHDLIILLNQWCKTNKNTLSNLSRLGVYGHSSSLLDIFVLVTTLHFPRGEAGHGHYMVWYVVMVKCPCPSLTYGFSKYMGSTEI